MWFISIPLLLILGVRLQIATGLTAPIGANGSPPDMVGQVKI